VKVCDIVLGDCKAETLSGFRCVRILYFDEVWVFDLDNFIKLRRDNVRNCVAFCFVEEA